MTPIVDDVSSWTWPADVRAKLDAQRIAVPAAPEPRAPEPRAQAEPDPADELLFHMFGGL